MKAKLLLTISGLLFAIPTPANAQFFQFYTPGEQQFIKDFCSPEDPSNGGSFTAREVCRGIVGRELRRGTGTAAERTRARLYGDRNFNPDDPYGTSQRFIPRPTVNELERQYHAPRRRVYVQPIQIGY